MSEVFSIARNMANFRFREASEGKSNPKPGIPKFLS